VCPRTADGHWQTSAKYWHTGARFLAAGVAGVRAPHALSSSVDERIRDPLSRAKLYGLLPQKTAQAPPPAQRDGSSKSQPAWSTCELLTLLLLSAQEPMTAADSWIIPAPSASWRRAAVKTIVVAAAVVACCALRRMKTRKPKSSWRGAKRERGGTFLNGCRVYGARPRSFLHRAVAGNRPLRVRYHEHCATTFTRDRNIHSEPTRRLRLRQSEPDFARLPRGDPQSVVW